VDAKEALRVLQNSFVSAIQKAEHEGTQAFQRGDYSTAQSAAQKAEALTTRLRWLTELERDLESLISGGLPVIRKSRTAKKPKVRKHLSPGVKTSDKEFRLPILQALVELGGSGAASDVLDIVERKMRMHFKDVDYDVLADGRSLRWRNTAQWERQAMKEAGLIKPDSPRGVWEITEQGRLYLEIHDE
jgi:restriction system protein